jgi:hypothetical protein
MQEHAEFERTQDASPDVDPENAPASAADIASAGRSCLAILVLIGAIAVLVIIWFVVRSFGASF